jgi:hypothetical protein
VIPPGWERLDVPQASLAFRNDAERASLLINARCGRKIDNVPLSALVNQLLIGATERTYTIEQTIPMDDREAMQVQLIAKLDGVPRNYEVFVLKKDGCVYDFVAVSPPDSAATVSATLGGLVQGFHTLPRGEH